LFHGKLLSIYRRFDSTTGSDSNNHGYPGVAHVSSNHKWGGRTIWALVAGNEWEKEGSFILQNPGG
jgi:hypothetical protein